MRRAGSLWHKRHHSNSSEKSSTSRWTTLHRNNSANSADPQETQMARLDGLSEEVEEKLGRLAGEVNSLDVKMTNNVTALGQSLSQHR